MGNPPLAILGPELTTDERARYARHLLLPEIGLEGQRRLKAARVLVVGAGGLGSPALMYLAAAGVGTIGVVDDDVVDASNLQRQVIHGTSDVGRPKAESAAEAVAEINPLVTVEQHGTRLDSGNALDVIGGYDLVVDGADNFPTRYLVNDACAMLGKPHVWGSIFRFDGQVSVWWAGRGPCYRCVFPDPPPPDAVPSCATGGVLGVLCAAVGSVQVSETIKLLVGQGDPLLGRLMVHDALRQTWDTLTVRRDPACPVCGDSPTVTELIDYEDFCGMPGAHAGADGPAGSRLTSDGAAHPGVGAVSAADLADRLARRAAGEEDFLLVDVREPNESDIVAIPGADLIPLGEFTSGEALAKLPHGIPLVVMCKSGVRSARAAEILVGAGHTDVDNLEGGVLAWVRDVDPSLPGY